MVAQVLLAGERHDDAVDGFSSPPAASWSQAGDPAAGFPIRKRKHVRRLTNAKFCIYSGENLAWGRDYEKSFDCSIGSRDGLRKLA
jgi:hypothetical protein